MPDAKQGRTFARRDLSGQQSLKDTKPNLRTREELVGLIEAQFGENITVWLMFICAHTISS